MLSKIVDKLRNGYMTRSEEGRARMSPRGEGIPVFRTPQPGDTCVQDDLSRKKAVSLEGKYSK